MRCATEPCLCGAEDFPRCYPHNFVNGHYVVPDDAETVTDDCDGDFDDGYDPHDNCTDFIAENGERDY